MKKLLAIFTLAAVICVGSAGVFAGHSVDHKYSKLFHKETVKVSGLLVGDSTAIAVEVWNKTSNLGGSSVNYTRVSLFGATSRTCSASKSNATRGYYAYLTKSSGSLVKYSKGAWETNNKLI